MGIITGHGGLPKAQHPRWASTFRVLSESDSSELSCTSMSGAWYLENTGVGCSGARPCPGQSSKAPPGQQAFQNMGLRGEEMIFQ